MFCEDFTKKLQEELEDPGLRVEFNEETELYEVMKWMQTGCDTGYHQTQATYPKFDGRVIEELRKCRPGRESAEEVIRKMNEQKAQIKAARNREMDDLARTAIFDMHKRLRPVLYFYGKDGTLR